MSSFSKHCVVIGGGLSGIAAATALAKQGMRVTLLEAKSQLGGRATSYTDRASGEVIDNCQHVSMGCCTNLRHLCEQLEINDHFRTEGALNFVPLDGRIAKFSESFWPAPFHLTTAFLCLPYLSMAEKFWFAMAIRKLAHTSDVKLQDVCFLDWLKQQRQSENLIRNVWEVVLISALSESLDRVDAAYARKVFVDGFLKNREGWRVEIPVAALDDLYSKKAADSLRKFGVKIELNARVTKFYETDQLITAVECQDRTRHEADVFVLTIPQYQVSALLSDFPACDSLVNRLQKIESAPITSVHLWFDKPIMNLPHAVLLDRMSQWVFSRGTDNSSPPRERYQVVISASRNLDEMTQAQVIDTVQKELKAIWPESQSAKLLHARMITERRAVFSVTPGINQLRPAQQSPVDNLQLAGDWTQTDWPATMEGAVRSGYLAAENILKKHHLSCEVLQADLPVSFLSRWLLRIR